MIQIDLNLGKYTVILDDEYRLTALKYGQTWRDLTGDGLIMSLVQRTEANRMLILRLSELVKRQKGQLDLLGGGD